jgi:hypothetical protein
LAHFICKINLWAQDPWKRASRDVGTASGGRRFAQQLSQPPRLPLGLEQDKDVVLPDRSLQDEQAPFKTPNRGSSSNSEISSHLDVPDDRARRVIEEFDADLTREQRVIVALDLKVVGKDFAKSAQDQQKHT